MSTATIERAQENAGLAAAGLPQIAGTLPTGPVSSFDELFKQMGTAPAPEAKGSTKVAPLTSEEVALIVPELVRSLVQGSGEAWPGAVAFTDAIGEFGPAGAMYVHRPYVKVSPALAQFILQNFGQANRDSTKSRLEQYTESQRHGNWSYVGNTAIFTVPVEGQVMCLGIEQHNGAHTMKSLLESGKTILMTLIFGIPKSQRDKIDDNQQRTAKDIVTTRSEMRTLFHVGSIIGGAVQVTAALAASMMRNVSETFRIVDDVRGGKNAKTGGSRSKIDVGQKLDQYVQLLGKTVQSVIALDARLETKTINSKGEVKQKTSGGLLKRISASHASAMLALGAGYHALDGSFGYDEKAGLKILTAYRDLGYETIVDPRNPMVALRDVIDYWNDNKIHKGSDGMNVRFSALKFALMMVMTGTPANGKETFINFGPKSAVNLKINVDVKNENAVNGVVGLDDWVDASDKLQLNTAGRTVEGTEEKPLPFINEDA